MKAEEDFGRALVEFTEKTEAQRAEFISQILAHHKEHRRRLQRSLSFFLFVMLVILTAQLFSQWSAMVIRSESHYLCGTGLAAATEALANQRRTVTILKAARAYWGRP